MPASALAVITKVLPRAAPHPSDLPELPYPSALELPFIAHFGHFGACQAGNELNVKESYVSYWF